MLCCVCCFFCLRFLFLLLPTIHYCRTRVVHVCCAQISFNLKRRHLHWIGKTALRWQKKKTKQNETKKNTKNAGRLLIEIANAYALCEWNSSEQIESHGCLRKMNCLCANCISTVFLHAQRYNSDFKCCVQTCARVRANLNDAYVSVHVIRLNTFATFMVCLYEVA